MTDAKQQGDASSKSTGQTLEISRDEAWKILLENEDMTDFELRCSDGALVGANRCILGARSALFRAMLYGNFKEAAQPVVSIDYKETVIRHLLEYIYTDKFPKVADSGLPIETLVSLCDASHFFQFPHLCKHVRDALQTTLRKEPSHALTILETAVVPELKELALDCVRHNFEAVCNSDTALSMSAEVLETILKDKNMLTEEIKLFTLLQQWSTVTDESTGSDSVDRVTFASSVVRYINLEGIAASKLATTVASSGLVSNEQLTLAFQRQAMAAESEHGIQFKRMRATLPALKWIHEGVCFSIGMVECPPMKSGIHMWKFKVGEHEENDHIDLGLVEVNAQGEFNSNCSSVFLDKTGIIESRSDSRQTEAVFGVGSTVMMSLDLTHDGILTASIDDGASIVLSSDIKDDANSDEPLFLPGFVCAKSVGRRAFRLAEFHSPMDVPVDADLN